MALQLELCCSSVCLISARAASERGTSEHLNGFGRLKQASESDSIQSQVNHPRAHLTEPIVTSISCSTMFPSGSLGFAMVKTARMDAIVIQRWSKATQRPGQTLRIAHQSLCADQTARATTHRRPNPKAI